MSTLSVTPPPRAPGRAAPKLRDSCQTCASSKVKCTKEKPKCSRCAKRGLTCEYLATKRAGRTSYKKQAAAAAAAKLRLAGGASHDNLNNDAILVDGLPGSQSAGVLPSQATSTSSTPSTVDGWFALNAFAAANNSSNHHGLFGDMNQLPSFDDYLEFSATPTTALSPAGSTESHQMPDPHFFSINNIEGLDLRSESSASSSSCYGTGPSSSGFADFDHAFGNPGFAVGSLQEPSSLTSRRSSANTTATSSPQPPACRTLLSSSSSHCSSSSSYTSCVPRALDLLKQLTAPAQGAPCPMSTSGGSRSHNTPAPLTIQAVIAHNRQTIEAVRSMLECPCSADNFLPIVLTLVIYKVFGWYAAAARPVQFTQSSSPSSPTASNSSRSSSISDRSSCGSPHVVVVGSYYGLDGEDSPYMAGQLVLSELHRVQRIVNQLSVRLTAAAANSSCSAYDINSSSIEAFPVSLFSAPLLHQFEKDLKKGLKKLSLDIVRELEREFVG